MFRDSLVRSVLANPDCADFARTILAGVSKKKNPVLEGGDFMKIFNDFLNQKKPHALIDNNLPTDSRGLGNADGNIPQGTAKLYSPLRYSEGQVANTVINELFHLAGSKGLYLDSQLANALHDSPYRAEEAEYLAPDVNVSTQGISPSKKNMRTTLNGRIAIIFIRLHQTTATLLQHTVLIRWESFNNFAYW